MDEAIVTTALDTDTGVALKPFQRIEKLQWYGRGHGVGRGTGKEAGHGCKYGALREHLAAFAREREISTALLYTWRRELRYVVEAAKLPSRNEPMFVPVVGEATPPISGDSVEVEIGGAHRSDRASGRD